LLKILAVIVFVTSLIFLPVGAAVHGRSPNDLDENYEQGGGAMELKRKDWVAHFALILAINVRRRRGDMTQQELAKAADISQTAVERIESRKPITLQTLLKIAHALKVEPGDLFLSEQDRQEITLKSKKLLDTIYGGVFGEKGKPK
jgi:DNA-binding Xre family transcriptional regulator